MHTLSLWPCWQPYCLLAAALLLSIALSIILYRMTVALQSYQPMPAEPSPVKCRATRRQKPDVGRLRITMTPRSHWMPRPDYPRHNGWKLKGARCRRYTIRRATCMLNKWIQFRRQVLSEPHGMNRTAVINNEPQSTEEE